MFDTLAYRFAIGGEGELAGEWADKPHRLVYDLASEVERLQGVLLELGRLDLVVGDGSRPVGWDEVKARIDANRVLFEDLVSQEPI